MREQHFGGRYRLVRQLGEGGMGQVWEAQDTTLDRPVAVKVISLLGGGGSRGDAARARFLREAQITARLQHPNIVTVYNLEQDGTGESTVPFLVMELLQGRSLDAVLHRGSATLPDAARWGAQVCDALSYAHDAGFLHRDIKPSNILLTDSGIVKVLDFGIAKAADSYATGEQVTKTGFIVGTPPYMPPEQAGGSPEPRSDLYSLGCLLFELITGRLPFQANDTMGYLSAHCNQEPPAPSSLVKDIPPSWDDLVLKLLHKDPAKRYPNAAALAEALRHLGDIPEPAPPAGEPTPPPTLPVTRRQPVTAPTSPMHQVTQPGRLVVDSAAAPLVRQPQQPSDPRSPLPLWRRWGGLLAVLATAGLTAAVVTMMTVATRSSGHTPPATAATSTNGGNGAVTGPSNGNAVTGLLSPGSEISLRATTPCCRNAYIRISNGDVVIAQITSTSSYPDRDDATWIVSSGLAESSCFSFESKSHPGDYLRHANGLLLLEPDNGRAQFRADATFCPVPGFDSQGSSFQSLNNPAAYIRHYYGKLYLASDGGTSPWDSVNWWKFDVSWVVSQPWAP
jgi:serine/threonine protein kinase